MYKTRYLLPLLAVLLAATSGCALIDKRFDNPEDKTHPATQVFLDYTKAVKQAESFDEIYQDFYPEGHWKFIEATMGWARLVYSSSFKGLKTGQCEKISLSSMNPTGVELLCTGKYWYPNNLLEGQKFDMELKVQMQQVGGEWYMGRSGMRHQTRVGSWAGYGLKFQ